MARAARQIATIILVNLVIMVIVVEQTVTSAG